MNKGGAKAPSQRQLRVAEEVRHVLARVIERDELHDPTLAGVPVTVSEVRISPDLNNATVFVSPLGGGDVDTLVRALSHAAPFLRRRVGQEMTLRHVPALSFQADRSFDEVQRIQELLNTAAGKGIS